MSQLMSQAGDHAVVIGASIGGLLAARVLAERFARVTVLERDETPDSGEPRRGVPQGRHTHGLLASGATTLEALFPGLGADVVAAGGRIADVAKDCVWHNFGVALQRAPSGLKGFLISRPLLETLIRRRVRALPNVTLRDGRDVVELEHRAGRVVGVRHKTAGAAALPETCAADLVVDASGRGGRALSWLEALGYEKPVEERVEVDIAYATRRFRRRAEDLPGREVVVLAANPANWRPAVICSQEGDCWTVTLSGYFGDRPPEDLDGFIAHARSLPTPEIYETIRDAEPLGEASVYNFKASQRRRFEKLKRFPEGYLAFGDALTSFNPVYGQGMSVVAAEAVALAACLDRGTGGLARRFFAAAARVVDTPWEIAVGADLAHPASRTPIPAAARFLNGYVAKVFEAGHRDARVAQAFLRVANLAAPPPTLFHPATVARVIRAHWRPATPPPRPVPA